jgi:hypothetical protein
VEVPRETSSIRARALDADDGDRAEVLEPAQQLLVAETGRLESFDSEQRAFLVERCDHVDVEVRIDAAGHASCQSGHRHPFLGRLGWHRTRWTTDKTAMGRLRASSYEVTPSNRRVSVGDRARPTDRTKDSRKTSAGS